MLKLDARAFAVSSAPEAKVVSCFKLPSAPWSALLRRTGFIAVLLLALSCLWMPTRAYAAFGISSGGGYYTVDTGANLVFKVNQANGDITSLRYNGVEYQDPSKGSHINSGLGTATVTGALWGSQTIKIEVVADTLTHYYLARKGFNNIYMGTYFTEEPSIGLVRYIVRIPSAKLPNGPTTSDIRNNLGAVEASDVFRLANGETRSKHYSDHRLIDFTTTGATGPGVGVFMVRSNHEGGSGGPFYRTIDNQCGDDQEIYEIINYGEGQTEPFRFGVFNGPYILTFTDGSIPTVPIDTSWIHSTGIDATLKGWVQNRGIVTGQATGIPSGFQGVVGFANVTAQYWSTVNNGTYTSPWMIPGTYTMTLYKGELAVATSGVTVTASTTPVTQNIASAEIVPFQRWRIGAWDGTPMGFLNADKVTAMHPSDVRMSSWGPVTYTVGSSSASDFPAYQWKDINNPTTIKFNLTAGEVASHTLRVGLTCAYSGARPRVSVNAWTSAIPNPSTQPDSRTLTVGTYRGNNVTYTYNIPASAFIAGTNTLTLTVVSGSGSTGFLSAGYSYDCVELDGPLNGTFRITPQHAQDKALTVLDSNPNNGAQTVISTYQDSAKGQFLLDQQSDGSYRVRTLLTGNRCVELPFGDASEGSLIKLWDDNGNSAQRWNLIPISGEWAKIVPVNDATKCMDVSGGPLATADGTTVQSWTYLGGSNQLWKLTPVTPAPVNVAPVAQNDNYSLNEDTPLNVAENGLLANDSDGDSNPLTVVDSNLAVAGVQPVTAPTHGTLVLNANGSFSYQPAANYNGLDSFSYQITDGQLTSNTATVNLTINSVNDTPVAKNGTYSTPQNTALTVALDATDVEGDTLTYSTSTPAHGTLTGTVPNLTYTPTAGYYGPDSFTFTANDGSANSNVAKVDITVTSTKPTVAVSTPFPGQKLLISAFKAGSLTGTASDDVGVTSVETKITRLRGGVTQIWNGTAWGTASARIPTTLTGSGTNVNWSMNNQFPPTSQLDVGEYVILVYATNTAGNAGSATTRVTLYSSDSEAPISQIFTPAVNQKVLISSFTAGAITGGATDNVGVSNVRVKLSRKRGTNYYWNGTAFTTTAFLLNATVTPAGGTSVKWNIDSQMPPASQLDSGLYQLDVYAVDVANNKSVVVTRPFTLGTDFTAPSVAIVAPTASQKISLGSFGAGTINGTAGDNLGVSSVKIKLMRKRGTITTYWNGSAFTTTTATVDATVTTAGGTSVTWKLDNVPTTAQGLDAGAYTLYASAYDAAGNTRASASRGFTLTAPVSGVSVGASSSAAGS